jgi:hypothetical protein
VYIEVCALNSELQLWISSLTVGVWRSHRITVFGTYQGMSTVMHKILDWKRSRISVFEVEAIHPVCLSIILNKFLNL